MIFDGRGAPEEVKKSLLGVDGKVPAGMVTVLEFSDEGVKAGQIPEDEFRKNGFQSADLELMNPQPKDIPEVKSAFDKLKEAGVPEAVINKLLGIKPKKKVCVLTFTVCKDEQTAKELANEFDAVAQSYEDNVTAHAGVCATIDKKYFIPSEVFGNSDGGITKAAIFGWSSLIGVPEKEAWDYVRGN